MIRSRRPPFALRAVAPVATVATAREVDIAAGLGSVDAIRDGRTVTIARTQEPGDSIRPESARTSCVPPDELAPGVKTIAEMDVLDLLERMASGDTSVLVIDSRTPASALAVIPGTVSIPWDTLDAGRSDPAAVAAILEARLGARRRGEAWNFDEARTLAFLCNGPGCGQSSAMIEGLLEIGYPPRKLLWYRGGMQDWESRGLATR